MKYWMAFHFLFQVHFRYNSVRQVTLSLLYWIGHLSALCTRIGMYVFVSVLFLSFFFRFALAFFHFLLFTKITHNQCEWSEKFWGIKLYNRIIPGITHYTFIYDLYAASSFVFCLYADGFACVPPSKRVKSYGEKVICRIISWDQPLNCT